MATPVEAAFWTFAGNLEVLNKQPDLVAQRQRKVEKLLRRRLTVVRSLLIGSYVRNTITRPMEESDVDLLVLLDYSKHKRWLDGEGVERVRERFSGCLAGRRRPSTVPIGRHALHLRFPEFRLDVMPALANPVGGYLVPDFVRREWIPMHPAAFDEQIARLDQQHDRRAIPLIRMLKAWNRTTRLPLRGFHLECLVYRYLEEGWPIREYSVTIPHLLKWLRSALNRPVEEPIFGQIVDAYLDEGEGWPKPRQQVVTILAETMGQIELATRAAQADWRDALRIWKGLFGPLFPIR